MSEITLVGLASNLENESRALAYLKINHNSMTYDWQVFIPSYVDNLQNYLESITSSIIAEIDDKELIWTNLDPKTRIMEDPITGLQVQIEISKEEIVKPNIPDYYALRRNEYPPLGDQLDAIWKGENSTAFVTMRDTILAIKSKYPKP